MNSQFTAEEIRKGISEGTLGIIPKDKWGFGMLEIFQRGKER